MTGAAMFGLQGKTAVVTGGYGVLGGSIARGLARAGARVALLGRSREKSEALATEIRESGAEAISLSADVLNEEQLRSARDELLAKWDRVDILVNAAGGNVARARTDNVPVFGLPVDAFDEVVRLNLHGSVIPSLIFGEVMARQGSGCIINISSMASEQALSGVLGYSVAKAGIDNLTKWMAADVARQCGPGIRVNAVAPGFFISAQNRTVLIKPDGSYSDRAKAVLAKTPMGRFGEPEELDGAIQWLCSDAASFVTGAIIPVDGGFSAFSGV